MLSFNEKDQLKKLGNRLKSIRIERNDSQKEFSCRIDVSIPTLHKMEQGHPSISIGKWVRTLSILGKLEELEQLLAPSESLFERYKMEKKVKQRQRVSRKRHE